MWSPYIGQERQEEEGKKLNMSLRETEETIKANND
jgi:hypothetical protein